MEQIDELNIQRTIERGKEKGNGKENENPPYFNYYDLIPFNDYV